MLSEPVHFKIKVLSLNNYPEAFRLPLADFSPLRASPRLAAVLAPKNIVSLARMKKLAPFSVQLPTSSGLPQKMPDVLPCFSVAAMIFSMAFASVSAPAGP